MWYLVMSRSLPEKEEDKQRNYEEHRQWLDEQHKAGRLLFSGPTTDGGYGVYIMLASSLDEAKTDRRPRSASRPRHTQNGGFGMARPPRLPSSTDRPSPMLKPWRGANKRRHGPNLERKWRNLQQQLRPIGP